MAIENKKFIKQMAIIGKSCTGSHWFHDFQVNLLSCG